MQILHLNSVLLDDIISLLQIMTEPPHNLPLRVPCQPGVGAAPGRVCVRQAAGERHLDGHHAHAHASGKTWVLSGH